MHQAKEVICRYIFCFTHALSFKKWKREFFCHNIPSKCVNGISISEIFSKVAQNAVIQAQPSVLHFGGFEPGQKVKKVLRLVNVSTEVQRMHVIPPQTKFFYIHYKKGVS